ncbi:TetR/AcrR family transcriptional regulator [Jonesiaceae bacterium BS-20]|uniref:TetR/AcrR family transcriptional regulator n=1 Tax=Jonesiaceae bacterium BS-20 TaxID=3120821 RepID=A0AAU7DVW4_9MICO
MARRGGYAKGAISRELILDRAVELFGEVGYSAASLRDVARHSGMTHSGLLHHFPNKEALLAGVLERRDKVEYERFATMAGGTEEAKHGLFELLDHEVHDVPGFRLFNMLAAEATSQKHPANSYFVDRYRKTHALVTDIMQSVRDAGSLKTDIDTGSLARMSIALMDGLQLQWLLEATQTGELDAAKPCDVVKDCDQAEHVVPSEPVGGPPVTANNESEKATAFDMGEVYADFLKLLGIEFSSLQAEETAVATDTVESLQDKVESVARQVNPVTEHRVKQAS